MRHLSKTAALFAAAWMLILAACGESAPPSMPLNLVAYNHLTYGIGDFDVQLKGGEKNGGGFLDAGSGGGGMICCISVPQTWQPGLMAHVNAEVYRSSDEKYQISKDVEIPRYTSEEAGHMSVHFLRDGEVKIFVTKYALWHQNYPLKGKEAELKPGS